MSISRTLAPRKPYKGKHRSAPATAGLHRTAPRAAAALAGLGISSVTLVAGAGAASADVPKRRTPVLAYDSRGEPVRDLQFRLEVQPVSGWFGPKTQAAVRAFQAREGLAVTGVVDKWTWRALPKTKKRASRSSVAPDRRRTGVEGLNWAALARCEASGNPRAYNPAGYYGLYQFNLGTWRSVGGSGLPTEASADEQTYRAQLLYTNRGAQPWPHCGRLLFS